MTQETTHFFSILATLQRLQLVGMLRFYKSVPQKPFWRVLCSMEVWLYSSRLMETLL